MRQQILDYKDYGDRIYRELKKQDPDKYKHITKQSVVNHIWHINYCIIKILSKAATEFVSPYIVLRKGYHRIKSSKDDKKLRRLYQRKRMKELWSIVPDDNVLDRLNVITCVFKTSWDGRIHDFDTKSYVWRRFKPFNYQKPHEQKKS